MGGSGTLHGGRKMADDCGEVVMGDTEAVEGLVEGATGVVVGTAEQLVPKSTWCRLSRARSTSSKYGASWESPRTRP